MCILHVFSLTPIHLKRLLFYLWGRCFSTRFFICPLFSCTTPTNHTRKYCRIWCVKNHSPGVVGSVSGFASGSRLLKVRPPHAHNVFRYRFKHVPHIRRAHSLRPSTRFAPE